VTQVVFFAIVALLALVASLLYAEYMRRQRATTTADGPEDGAPHEARKSPVAPAANREVQVVAEWLAALAFEQTGCTIAQDRSAHRRIAEAAQAAVHDLEQQTETLVSLPGLVSDETGPKDLEVRLTRDVIDLLVKS